MCSAQVKKFGWIGRVPLRMMADGLLERRGLRVWFLDEGYGPQCALRKARWEWAAQGAEAS